MDTVTIIGVVANAFVAICAGVALFIAIRQVRISREVSALAAYETYHMTCLQYPEFATGSLHFESCSEEKKACYCTFVLFALMTDERVLTLYPDDESWIFAVKDDIRIHRKLIGSDYFVGYRENQAPVIRALIDDVLVEGVEEAQATTGADVIESHSVGPQST